jgi:ATP-binding cassette subfamily E protein 1
MPRLAVVDPELCNPGKCQLECIRDCPVNRTRKPCIELTEDKSIAVISEELCTGCGICPKVCPFHAITIVNTVAPVEEKLAYRYGENLFSLYGLALPKRGVVAIVGENGCGKTTNVKLITGQLEPQNYYSKEVKTYFAEQDFEKIATKPQELSGNVKGKVGELLRQINEAGRLDKLNSILDLQQLYEREFSQLSGGELQRVVVAAVLLRDKQTFILDEPLAYLDYAYRIRLAEYLKSEFSQMQVLVVDHDLSLLSHFCSAAYISFGVPGAYGIISQPYSVDRAINMFLDGFIEPENVRFRQSIKYETYPPEAKFAPSFQIPPLEVKRGAFKLTNPQPVQLFAGEVVGIAGPNGTGKSSLCAELEKEFNSAASLKVQILPRSAELAGQVITDARQTVWGESYVRGMGLGNVEFRKLDSLSLGELQKVEILRCLSKEDASLYLLDEPTTALDAPARIRLSKLLREKAESESSVVLVVDHDLEFLYNAVDRLIVFEGEPSVTGRVAGAFAKVDGIARLLSQFDLSYRSEPGTKRLKLNKRGSVKDRELKESGSFVER